MTQAPTQSENINELLTALCKAQSTIQCAIKDKKNPFFKSSYADLNSVWEVCREPLTANGLSVLQTVEERDDKSFLVTWLGHNSGQWVKSYLKLLPQKNDPQAMGSAITYNRRYGLSAIVGICSEEDDDGEKAMNRDARKHPLEEAKKPTSPVPDIKKVISHEKKDPKISLLTMNAEENHLYDQFIFVIPETDREWAKKYLAAASESKNWRLIETVNFFRSNMDKFKENLNTYKEKQKEKDLKKTG